MPSLLGAVRDLVIFDTDSGAFGDDGTALVMLARSPLQVSLEGVTVVPGNVWAAQGAEYMIRILDLLKRPSVPVYLGAEEPLVHTADMAKEAARRWDPLIYTGAFALSRTAPAVASRVALRRPRRDGLSFFINEIERHPGQVTVLALGPMTNIAIALRMRPDIETKIKRIVFMGGAYRVPGNASPSAEFNFWFDPEAARIVLRSRIPKKIMFGLDICNQAPMHKSQFDQIASIRSPITDLFREDFGNRYPGFLKHADAVGYLWDSLAAAYLLDPDFVTRYETRYLDVQSNFGQHYGAIVPLDRKLAPSATPVTVMLGLNYNRVFALYRDRLIRQD